LAKPSHIRYIIDEKASTSGKRHMQPLTGVKVVELANNIAGPYAGYILAMLGAEVLKIERPEGGDDARAWGPPFWKDTSATFHALNVNKQA
jgi:crotonobetainyl-CoA:carnitine CoA-transferase CaiB-like acyl-CoA transferase